jgi:lysophospholipase
MTAVGLGEVSAPGQAAETVRVIPFEGNRLTADRARFQRSYDLAVKLPQIFVDGPTFGWLYAAFRAMDELSDPAFAQSIRVPILVVIGALDRLVSVVAAERLASEIRAGGLIVIAGAEHELFAERDVIREQFLAAFDAFIPGG